MPHFLGGPPILGIDDEINWRHYGGPCPPHINLRLRGVWAWGPPGPVEPYHKEKTCTCSPYLSCTVLPLLEHDGPSAVLRTAGRFSCPKK